VAADLIAEGFPATAAGEAHRWTWCAARGTVSVRAQVIEQAPRPPQPTRLLERESAMSSIRRATFTAIRAVILDPVPILHPRRDEGQGLAEYALILALIAIVAIVALIFLGGQVSNILSNVSHSI
jgi:pilus assembly protein Flp/PilA